MNDNETKFLDAVKSNDISKVKEYIEQGIDVSFNDNKAIKCSIVDGNLEMFELLLDKCKLDGHLEYFYQAKNIVDAYTRYTTTRTEEDLDVFYNIFNDVFVYLVDNNVSNEIAILIIKLYYKLYNFNFDPSKLPAFKSVADKYGYTIRNNMEEVVSSIRD